MLKEKDVNDAFKAYIMQQTGGDFLDRERVGKVASELGVSADSMRTYLSACSTLRVAERNTIGNPTEHNLRVADKLYSITLGLLESPELEPMHRLTGEIKERAEAGLERLEKIVSFRAYHNAKAEELRSSRTTETYRGE